MNNTGTSTSRATEKKCFCVGITGPSGCGKSTLAQGLSRTLTGRVTVVGEDPSTYRTTDWVPYAQRDPDTERPTHVLWPLVQERINQAVANKDEGSNVVIVEHFLLAFLPRVARQVDVCIILDDLESSSVAMEERGRAFRERRVGRQANRAPQERENLRTYFDKAVWPTYCHETRPALEQQVVQAMGEKHQVLQLDPLKLSSEEILSAAVKFVEQARSRLKTTE